MAKILSIYDRLKRKVDEAYEAPATPENRKILAELLVRKYTMGKLFELKEGQQCQQN